MAGAFQSGFKIGSDIGFRRLENERQAKLDARQEELDRRADAEYARKLGMQRQEDAAFDNLRTITNDGVVSGATGLSQPSTQMLYGGSTAYGKGAPAVQEAAGDYAREMNRFGGDNPAAATGLPKYDPTAAVTARPATELERERAYGGIAQARRDLGQMRASDQSQRGLQLEDETRTFVSRTRDLYNNRNKSEEDKQAWMTHAQPFTSMVSKYNGLDLDARVNPKTGALESIPYSGNKISEVSLEEALPYLLQSQRLVSKFGSPEAAVEALNKMTTEQRARVMGDTSYRFGIASKLDESAHRKREDDNNARRTRALEGHYGSEAALTKARIQQMEERAGMERTYGNLASAYAALPDDQKASEQGKGLARSMAVLKARFAGIPGLETKPRPAFKLEKVGEEAYYHDDSGVPVGRADPELGMIPVGRDPRRDQALMKKLTVKGVSLAASIDPESNLPTWLYVTPQGRKFTTASEALEAVESASAQLTAAERAAREAGRRTARDFEYEPQYGNAGLAY